MFVVSAIKGVAMKFLASIAKIAMLGITSDVFDGIAADLVEWLLTKLATSTKNTLDDEIVRKYIREIRAHVPGD